MRGRVVGHDRLAAVAHPRSRRACRRAVIVAVASLPTCECAAPRFCVSRPMNFAPRPRARPGRRPGRRLPRRTECGRARLRLRRRRSALDRRAVLEQCDDACRHRVEAFVAEELGACLRCARRRAGRRRTCSRPATACAALPSRLRSRRVDGQARARARCRP